jgi:hypothetical protein
MRAADQRKREPPFGVWAMRSCHWRACLRESGRRFRSAIAAGAKGQLHRSRRVPRNSRAARGFRRWVPSRTRQVARGQGAKGRQARTGARRRAVARPAHKGARPAPRPARAPRRQRRPAPGRRLSARSSFGSAGGPASSRGGVSSGSRVWLVARGQPSAGAPGGWATPGEVGRQASAGGRQRFPSSLASALTTGTVAGSGWPRRSSGDRVVPGPDEGWVALWLQELG